MMPKEFLIFMLNALMISAVLIHVRIRIIASATIAKMRLKMLTVGEDK